VRQQALTLLEEQSQKEHIDLYYADESGVSPEGYVPYGGQFSDEPACMASAKGQTLNCFALISRKNQLSYAISQQNITADFIIRQLDELSLTIEMPTVVVMDNAKVPTAAKVKRQLEAWQKRGLFIFICPLTHHLSILPKDCGRSLKQDG
jgi:hypothetical protein